MRHYGESMDTGVTMGIEGMNRIKRTIEQINRALIILLAALAFLAGEQAMANDSADELLTARKQLRQVRTQYGSDHPKTAEILYRMGRLNFKRRAMIEAESLFKQALAIWEVHLGGTNQKTENCLEALAALYLAEKWYSDAELPLRRTLAIREQRLGPGSPKVAVTLYGLGETLWKLRRMDEAEFTFLRALKIDEKHYGANSPRLVPRLNNMGRFYFHKNERQKARVLLERAVSILQVAYGAQDPRHIAAIRNLERLDIKAPALHTDQTATQPVLTASIAQSPKATPAKKAPTTSAVKVSPPTKPIPVSTPPATQPVTTKPSATATAISKSSTTKPTSGTTTANKITSMPPKQIKKAPSTKEPDTILELLEQPPQVETAKKPAQIEPTLKKTAQKTPEKSAKAPPTTQKRRVIQFVGHNKPVLTEEVVREDQMPRHVSEFPDSVRSMRYYLLMGCFSSEPNIKRLDQQMKDLDLPYYKKPLKRPDGDMTCFNSGPYMSRTSAGKMAQRVRQKTIVKDVLIRESKD
ncbi:MAG: tetratricopeptide repeat protein [Magnetococcales bacterium]|nr:tetratricopeptide repeat protein [Magnetococcales bacterium]